MKIDAHAQFSHYSRWFWPTLELGARLKKRIKRFLQTLSIFFFVSILFGRQTCLKHDWLTISGQDTYPKRYLTLGLGRCGGLVSFARPNPVSFYILVFNCTRNNFQNNIDFGGGILCWLSNRSREVNAQWKYVEGRIFFVTFF